MKRRCFGSASGESVDAASEGDEPRSHQHDSRHCLTSQHPGGRRRSRQETPTECPVEKMGFPTPPLSVPPHCGATMHSGVSLRVPFPQGHREGSLPNHRWVPGKRRGPTP